MKVYFVTCDYPEDGSYLKVTVSHDKDIIKTFEGSDPLIVWYDYYKYLYSEEMDADALTESSSLHDWSMDVEGYSWQFFDIKTLEFIPWLKLGMYDVEDRYPACVIKDGMKNFTELKEYVAANRK